MSVPMPIEDSDPLPVPRTSMVGREQESADVSALLLKPSVALLTVTGPGGAGKTRLALRIASELAHAFPDGVCFVQLGPIHEHDLVVPTIAQALGLRDDGTVLIEERLIARLRDREMLLVLDNMEQLVDAGPTLVELLRACAGIKILVTSRAVLRLSVEHVYPISGLQMPEETSQLAFEDLSRIDAVKLFVERARAVDASFALTPENAPVIAEICHELDGLPLAIELAAARTRVLSPMALHARLSQRLMLLTGGFQDQPRRHRTIRDAIEWSVQLLSRSDQAVFRRLAVFAGDFTLGAAEVVADGPDEVVFESLGSLVDQSLLERIPSTDDEPRFGMLHTIRDFALEQLRSSDECAPVDRRHAMYFLNLAETAAGHLTGPEQARWLNDLDGVFDDLRAAMSWFAERDEAESQMRLATSLWRFGYTRGHLREARGWLQAALAGYQEPTALRATGLNAEGLLATLQGDTQLAVPRHQEAWELSAGIGDRRGIAVSLNGLGDAAAYEGSYDVALERFEGALSLFREIGDQRGIAGALTNLGNLHWDLRDLDLAVSLHQEALSLYQAVNDRRGLAWSATNLGILAVERGDPSVGAAHLDDALVLYRELNDPSGIVIALEGFAEIAHARDQSEIEATLYAAAHAIRDRIGAPVAVGDRERVDAVVDAIRYRLGDDFSASWERGTRLSVNDAIAVALALVDGEPINVPRAASRSATDTHGLSSRELEVVRLVAEGKSNTEISDVLCISPRTVTTHISNIFNKLDIPNRSALAAFAHREGIV